MRRTDFTDQRFGKLVALEFYENRVREGTDNHTTYWKFKCDCGNEIIRCPFDMKRIKNQACRDCLNGPGSWQWKGTGEISAELFHKIRISAKDRDLEFTVSIEELWELFLEQKHKCAFTGWELKFGPWGTSNRHLRTASLDRIDSQEGYINGNLQWVHKEINRLKNNMKDPEFIRLCNLVAKNQLLINKGKK